MICKKCNKEVQDGLMFYKHCGEKMKEDKKICRFCKKEIDKDSTFCSYCGADLADIRTIRFSSMGSLFSIDIDINNGCTYKDILNKILEEDDYFDDEKILKTLSIFDDDGKDYVSKMAEGVENGTKTEDEFINDLVSHKHEFIFRNNGGGIDSLVINDDDICHLLKDDDNYFYLTYEP